MIIIDLLQIRVVLFNVDKQVSFIAEQKIRNTRVRVSLTQVEITYRAVPPIIEHRALLITTDIIEDEDLEDKQISAKEKANFKFLGCPLQRSIPSFHLPCPTSIPADRSEIELQRGT